MYIYICIRFYIHIHINIIIMIIIIGIIKAPEPKPFQIADGNIGGAVTGAISLVLRLGTGVFALDKKVLDACSRPTKSLIIYEYEASPFCRKVREACALLDLTVEYRPCPGARAGLKICP